MSEDSVSDAFINKWFTFRDKWYKEKLDEYNNTPEDERYVTQELSILNLKDVIKELEPQTAEEKAYCKEALASFVALNAVHWTNKEVQIIVRAEDIPKKLTEEKFIFYSQYPDLVTSPPDKKSGCFIATATFENYNAPEVMFFRKWRDEILMETLIGQLFVRTYYFISPSVAYLVSKSKLLKNVSKLLLRQLIKSIKGFFPGV